MRRPLRTRVWFWKPQWYWHGWKTLSPVMFGDDQWHYKTLVLGWTVTGRVIIALYEFRDGKCDEHCPTNPWANVIGRCCRLAYVCPTSGWTECTKHGGFDVCCDDEFMCPGSNRTVVE